MALQYHLKIGEGDVAPYVLLPGDPGRVELMAEQWDEATRVAANREFVTFTGSYRGVPLSCVSTGIGAPSTAIAVEELARLGAHTFLRVGTCGTFQKNIDVGDFVIADGAMRLDGASAGYAPIEFPAVAHVDVIVAARDAAARLGYRAHVGITRSADTFYAGHPRPGSSFADYWQSDWRDHFDDLRRLNVLSAEMEASVLLVLARVWGLRAGAVTVVLDNMLETSGNEDFDPAAELRQDRSDIEALARLGSETIIALAKADADQGSKGADDDKT